MHLTISLKYVQHAAKSMTTVILEIINQLLKKVIFKVM